MFNCIHQVEPPVCMPSNTCLCGPPKFTHQTAAWPIEPFLHRSWQRVLYFTTARPFPLQNCPCTWGIWTPSNARLLGPTRVQNLNTISIGSTVLAGLTSVTDRHTDRPHYSVSISRPHLRMYKQYSDVWCNTSVRNDQQHGQVCQALSELTQFNWDSQQNSHW